MVGCGDSIDRNGETDKIGRKREIEMDRERGGRKRETEIDKQRGGKKER